MPLEELNRNVDVTLSSVQPEGVGNFVETSSPGTSVGNCENDLNATNKHATTTVNKANNTSKLCDDSNTKQTNANQPTSDKVSDHNELCDSENKPPLAAAKDTTPSKKSKRRKPLSRKRSGKKRGEVLGMDSKDQSSMLQKIAMKQVMSKLMKGESQDNSNLIHRLDNLLNDNNSSTGLSIDDDGTLESSTVASVISNEWAMDAHLHHDHHRSLHAELLTSVHEIQVEGSALKCGWIHVKLDDRRATLGGNAAECTDLKKRWAVLHNNFLLLFKTPASDHPSTAILLDGSHCQREIFNKETTMGISVKFDPLVSTTCFSITTRAHRTFYVVLNDDNERDSWIQAIGTSSFEHMKDEIVQLSETNARQSEYIVQLEKRAKGASPLREGSVPLPQPLARDTTAAGDERCSVCTVQ